jgi:uncharacterized repeat protein (TIGR03803 family)
MKLRIGCVVVGFLSLVLSMPAQTFTTLHSFDGADGELPVAPLVQATNGDLYGTTSDVSGGGSGTVFNITPSGTLATVHSFTGGGDGWNPLAGLVQAINGNLYGTTSGIDNNCTMECPQPSTVFSISPAGALTTLSQSTTGTYAAALIQATDGNFYGTTEGGGANNLGTVFKITPGGVLTTLHSFDGRDGSGPKAGLVQATNGKFYGTAGTGGARGGGTVFQMTPNGILTTLYSFCSQGNCTDGSFPAVQLIQATDGNFYGTTGGGGANNHGTAFQITPAGTLTTLYSFCTEGGSRCTDGYNVAPLVQATDGNFYGTTSNAGANSYGTIFKIAAGGQFTTLYSFCSQSGCTDGANPYAPLVQGTDGSFYGTTESGGITHCRAAHLMRFIPCGTIFSLSVGLGQFVETQPTSRKAGGAVKIFGTDLNGATSVAFNSSAAVFTVVSSSLITTTVPTDATTGFVTVTTPSGTLKSNKKFIVTP